MIRTMTSSIFIVCFFFLPINALAGPPIPPQALAAINREVQITAHAAACDVVNFLPAYYGHASGTPGKVAVGILDVDPENCGVNFPMTSLAVYRVIDGRIFPVKVPAFLSKYIVQNVESVSPIHGALKITVSYFGPGDPACCAKQKLSVTVHL